MATALPITTKPHSFDAIPFIVNWVAGDNVNGNSFGATGQETVHARNTDTPINAAILLTPGGTWSSGSFALVFTIGTIAYTTPLIQFNATIATIAAAVLAATSPTGTTLAAAYPAGNVTASGGPIATAAVTLTFTGLGVPTTPNGTVVAGLAGTGVTGLGGQVIAAPTVTSNTLAGTAPTLTPSVGTAGVGLHHFTVSSQRDPDTRLGDLGPVSLPAGLEILTQKLPLEAWSIGGFINMTVDSNLIQLWIERDGS